MLQIDLRYNNLKSLFLNILFPKECVGCEVEGAWLCHDCRDRILLNESFFCPYCLDKSIFGETCSRCKNFYNLDSLISATSYKDPRIKNLIHLLKYKGVQSSHEVFEQLISKFIVKFNLLFPRFDLIIPVPLHKNRLQERGFNQSEIIASILGREFRRNDKNIIMPEVIARVKNTPRQVDLTDYERIVNVKSSFQVLRKEEISNKVIMLVDDVYTSGTTIEECARALKESGAREVHGFVVAS